MLRHCQRHSVYRRQTRIARYAWSGLVVIACCGVGLWIQSVLLFVYGIVMGLVIFVALPPIQRRYLVRQIRSTLELDDHSGTLCEHELEITDESLVERTDKGEQTARWESIQLIDVSYSRDIGRRLCQIQPTDNESHYTQQQQDSNHL